MDTPKPLGYWLKHLHNLLEAHLALVLSDLGTDRREWQLLNTLARGPHTRVELERALAPFWTDEPRLSEVLRDLAARGWIATATESVTLTAAGVAAHAELTPHVERGRAVVLAGLSAEQYREVVTTLAVMARNVETAIAARD